MKQPLQDFVLKLVGARTSLAGLLALVSLLVFLGTGKASAQFGVDTGRGDRAGEGMRDEGRRGTGVGIGIGIGVGIGEALVDKAVQDDARKKSGAGSPARAARKGDTPAGKAGKNGEAKKKDGEDAPPTAVPNDPADGIDVPGGKIHRGTGTITGYKGGPRPGIYCWVHTTDKEKCKKFAQYQFVTVNIVAKWGNNPEANINEDVRKIVSGGYILNANGAHVVPGQLGADDYNDRKENIKTNAHMTDPAGGDVLAGPYSPRPVPGAGGDKGLIDAPSWNATASGFVTTKLVPEDLRKTPKKKSATKPADSDVGTIKFLQHFRTYVYCMEPRACLGFFEWDYDETVTVVMQWTEATSGDLGDQTFGGDMSSGGGKKKGKQAEEPVEKTWVPSFGVKTPSAINGPRIGAWTSPCP
jgi:hypothetical protein